MKKQNRKSWTMAYCGMAAALCVALMLLTGKWTTKGVHTVEEFDPDPYMEALNKFGLPWVVDENPVTVE